MQKLRLLVLAQQNNPEWISVPLVGYHHSEALANHHEVTLVTHIANREAILRRGAPWKELHAIDLGYWEKLYDWCFHKIFKGDHGSQILTVFRIPFYFAFEWLAWGRYKKALTAKDFDAVVRLTPVAPVTPSLFVKRCKKLGVPFVLGPINGGLSWPEGYSQSARQKEWISNLRFFYRYLPFAKSTYRDAAAIVVGSSATFAEFHQWHEKLLIIPENGIREVNYHRPPREPGAKLLLLSVGRMIPSKAVDLAIRAAAELLRQGLAEFTIVGDGAERKRLEALCETLGIKVHFTGMLPHDATMEYFKKSDVLVFPSIREFGGGVIFEAYATGCVPIVSDSGGPGDITIEGVTAYKVSLKGEDYTVREFARQLEFLAKNPDQLQKMSLAGQDFARNELSWEGKARQMTSILQWCLGRAPKPEYLPPRRLESDR